MNRYPDFFESFIEETEDVETVLLAEAVVAWVERIIEVIEA